MTVTRISTDNKLYKLSTATLHYDYVGGSGVEIDLVNNFDRILPIKAYVQINDDPYLFYLDVSQYVSAPPQWVGITNGLVALVLVDGDVLKLFIDSFTGESMTLHFTVFIYGQGQSF